MKLNNSKFLNHWLTAFHKFEQRIDALEENQRKLLLGAMLVGAALLCIVLVFIPQQSHRTALISQKTQLLDTIQALQTAIQKNKQSAENADKKKTDEIDAAKKLPLTSAVTGLFRDFIKKNTNLQLIQLTSSPPIKIQDAGQNFLVDGKAVSTTELTLIFSGDFNSVFEYLQKLEKLPIYFFWKSLSYQVNKYPEATIALTLEVLSIAPIPAPVAAVAPVTTGAKT